MNRLTTSPTPWLLALAALLTASFLMAYYVNLLQEAVARGSQFKSAQRETPAAPHKQMVTSRGGASGG